MSAELTLFIFAHYTIAAISILGLYLVLSKRVKSKWIKYFSFGNIPLITGTTRFYTYGF
ncbi:MAG: hypothetical protein HRT57_09210 [Crocinitomicaceae bacterium]|nr:hypothetical protein [Crocinitomicaceae bacterium]